MLPTAFWKLKHDQYLLQKKSISRTDIHNHRPVPGISRLWRLFFRSFSKIGCHWAGDSRSWLIINVPCDCALSRFPLAMEQPSIFLSVEAESLIQFAHYFLFGFSTFFNAVATFCLWKQAPDMQSEIKIYLYGMQVSLFRHSRRLS